MSAAVCTAPAATATAGEAAAWLMLMPTLCRTCAQPCDNITTMCLYLPDAVPGQAAEPASRRGSGVQGPTRCSKAGGWSRQRPTPPAQLSLHAQQLASSRSVAYCNTSCCCRTAPQPTIAAAKQQYELCIIGACLCPVTADAGAGGDQGHLQGRLSTPGHCGPLQRRAVCIQGPDGGAAQTRRR